MENKKSPLPNPSIAFQFVKKISCNYYEIDATGIYTVNALAEQ